MAKLPRKYQKILGGNSSFNGQFGSARAGTFVLDNDLDELQALTTWESGWVNAIISGSSFPTLEEMQGVDYVVTTQLAYLFQEGIAEYNAETEYHENSLVKEAGTVKLYKSLIDDNTGNPLTDGASWVEVIDFDQSLLPTLGSANTVLQVNAAGDALEYGKITSDNIDGGFNETGDIDISWRSTAKTGWIFIQGQSLGDTGSGADLTGSDYEDLYTFIWDNILDAYAAVSTGRGASAAADWAAGKTITMPDCQDSTPFGVGSTWALGEAKGSETIAKGNLPAETLSITGTAASGSTSASIPIDNNSGSGTSDVQAGVGGSPIGTLNVSVSIPSRSVTGATENMGSGTAFLPKGFGVNWMIKL